MPFFSLIFYCRKIVLKNTKLLLCQTKGLNSLISFWRGKEIGNIFRFQYLSGNVWVKQK